jgi:hypothetical protein
LAHYGDPTKYPLFSGRDRDCHVKHAEASEWKHDDPESMKIFDYSFVEVVLDCELIDGMSPLPTSFMCKMIHYKFECKTTYDYSKVHDWSNFHQRNFHSLRLKLCSLESGCNFFLMVHTSFFGTPKGVRFTFDENGYPDYDNRDKNFLTFSRNGRWPADKRCMLMMHLKRVRAVALRFYK